MMKTLRFHGYSDDTFGEYGVTKQDHDDSARSTHRAFRVAAPDGESLIVVGVYAPKGTPGCWVIGIQLDDVDGDGGGPLPSWPMRFTKSDVPYSPALEIDVPDDVTVTLVPPDRTKT